MDREFGSVSTRILSGRKNLHEHFEKKQNELSKVNAQLRKINEAEVELMLAIALAFRQSYRHGSQQ